MVLQTSKYAAATISKIDACIASASEEVLELHV